MTYPEDHPFHRLLATRYDAAREDEAIAILDAHPELAALAWPDPDERGQPFVQHATALHYAANDGKCRLMARLLDLGADPNAAEANWYRSVLGWAANNARLEAMHMLLDRGARPDSLNAVHAAAWGGPRGGAGRADDYTAALQLLNAVGADMSDRRFRNNMTPLAVARESGHAAAISYLTSIGAAET